MKYFCDICGVELTHIQRNDLAIHTSHPRDIEFHLCIKCLDKSIIDLMDELYTKGRIRLGERETIMHLVIEGDALFQGEKRSK